MDKTTIQVSLETKELLDEMKVIQRETYDDVIRRVLRDLLDRCEEGGDKDTIKLISSRLKKIQGGEVISTKELKSRLFAKSDNEVREGMG